MWERGGQSYCGSVVKYEGTWGSIFLWKYIIVRVRGRSFVHSFCGIMVMIMVMIRGLGVTLIVEAL